MDRVGSIPFRARLCFVLVVIAFGTSMVRKERKAGQLMPDDNFEFSISQAGDVTTMEQQQPQVQTENSIVVSASGQLRTESNSTANDLPNEASTAVELQQTAADAANTDCSGSSLDNCGRKYCGEPGSTPSGFSLSWPECENCFTKQCDKYSTSKWCSGSSTRQKCSAGSPSPPTSSNLPNCDYSSNAVDWCAKHYCHEPGSKPSGVFQHYSWPQCENCFEQHCCKYSTSTWCYSRQDGKRRKKCPTASMSTFPPCPTTTPAPLPWCCGNKCPKDLHLNAWKCRQWGDRQCSACGKCKDKTGYLVSPPKCPD
eukprot:gnl/TRDRNA2_/TRDRNA2_184347_c0_seq1.p1 gnl/TRDRNA2_/TRDRNA2_184347_c0~~gnl/TRDRNA2_/TRDRNA2_184347_c0_seq1.p1  ORF type:complete len:312 (+),score=7.52 gnl/TRDRNA2_/TRDRNA2_184347_c0_seq1:83-1018(+)